MSSMKWSCGKCENLFWVGRCKEDPSWTLNWMTSWSVGLHFCVLDLSLHHEVTDGESCSSMCPTVCMYVDV